MIFTWKILGVADECKSVHYFLSITDEENTVETEGNHIFSDNVITKPVEEIKESDLINWLESDTSKDDVNELKLNLEKQLKELKNKKNIGLPWLANTFKVQI